MNRCGPGTLSRVRERAGLRACVVRMRDARSQRVAVCFVFLLCAPLACAWTARAGEVAGLPLPPGLACGDFLAMLKQTRRARFWERQNRLDFTANKARVVGLMLGLLDKDGA